MRISRIFNAYLLLLFIPAHARADLIVNGSFETPAVPVGGFTNFNAGSTAITGWTVVGVDSAVVNETFTQSGITFNAQEGHQWIDLAGVTSNSQTSGVTQNVTTSSNQDYLLSFYVGSTTDNIFFFPSTVDLSINNGPRVSFTNPTAPSNRIDWRLFTTTFTATSSVTKITFFNGGAANNFHTGLDNISLTAVPEPSSVILVSLALIFWSHIWSSKSTPFHRRKVGGEIG